jgi:site-specific recombinase XerD
MKSTYTFDQALELYQEMLTVEKNVSEHTLESYSRDIKKLGHYLSNDKVTVEAVSLEDLRGFVASLFDKTCHPDRQHGLFQVVVDSFSFWF